MSPFGRSNNFLGDGQKYLNDVFGIDKKSLVTSAADADGTIID